MKVALYMRTAYTKDISPLAKQEEKLRLYVLANDLTIAKVYEDVGADRSDYKKMISESDEYDMILFTDISRISRKYKELMKFISLMEEKNKKWHCVNDSYNNYTVEGRFFSNFMLAFADKLENGEGL